MLTKFGLTLSKDEVKVNNNCRQVNEFKDKNVGYKTCIQSTRLKIMYEGDPDIRWHAVELPVVFKNLNILSLHDGGIMQVTLFLSLRSPWQF